MKYPVCDLHCDLLAYLATEGKKDPHHEEVRCSLPQLQKGGVFLQTLAVFTETEKGSAVMGRKQIEAFKRLPKDFVPLTQLKLPTQKENVHVVLSLENASSLAEEDEPLEKAFQRLEEYQKVAGPIFYISFTWNTENRFGGGNNSTVGLKKDGEALLEFLDRKNIAVDFSHTSDALASDILNHIDKKNLKVTPIASHSNFRAVTNHPRNLPDEIAKEIIKRGGVIGINLIRSFIGEEFQGKYLKNFEHAVQLGGAKNLCFGADFFYDDLSYTSLNALRPFYSAEFQDASCYPKLLSLLKTLFSESMLEDISNKNLQRFFEKIKV